MHVRNWRSACSAQSPLPVQYSAPCLTVRQDFREGYPAALGSTKDSPSSYWGCSLQSTPTVLASRLRHSVGGAGAVRSPNGCNVVL